MERRYSAAEFEATIGEGGTIRIPGPLARRFPQGTRVTFRLVEGTVSQILRRRGVTEEEVEEIAMLQLEERANVIAFLGSEGALGKNASFGRRASRTGRTQP